MQNEKSFRLVSDQRAKDDPIPFERRIQDRKPISGLVTVMQTWGEPEAAKNKISSIQLKDISETGLGGISQEAIEDQAKVTVFIPPHGPERGYDLYGKVVWCARGESGYEVGIELDKRLTACA